MLLDLFVSLPNVPTPNKSLFSAFDIAGLFHWPPGVWRLSLPCASRVQPGSGPKNLYNRCFWCFHKPSSPCAGRSSHWALRAALCFLVGSVIGSTCRRLGAGWSCGYILWIGGSVSFSSSLRGSPLPLLQLQILHTPSLTVSEVLCDELLHVDL